MCVWIAIGLLVLTSLGSGGSRLRAPLPRCRMRRSRALVRVAAERLAFIKQPTHVITSLP